MWTFTFPVFMTPECAREMVRQLFQWFSRRGASGVRCYESHRNGSLHIHAVMDRYLCVSTVRAWTNAHGFGRIHVKFLNPSDSGEYIAKELGKRKQAVRGKGVRVYATWGRAWARIGKSLIANIESGSEKAAAFRCWIAKGVGFVECCRRWAVFQRSGLGFQGVSFESYNFGGA
jgi:hypothetical protein